jgi:hypothetical protein
MTIRIAVDCNGRKYITHEPKLHESTWIGLTTEDVKVIEDNAPSKQMAIFMAEATLREKNT